MPGKFGFCRSGDPRGGPGWSVWCGIALLEAVWAVQGLCCWCRWLYLSPRAAGTGRSLHGTQPQTPWAAVKPRGSPFRASSTRCTEKGGRTDLLQPKLQRKARAGAFIAGTLSGREEQG